MLTLNFYFFVDKLFDSPRKIMINLPLIYCLFTIKRGTESPFMLFCRKNFTVHCLIYFQFYNQQIYVICFLPICHDCSVFQYLFDLSNTLLLYLTGYPLSEGFDSKQQENLLKIFNLADETSSLIIWQTT